MSVRPSERASFVQFSLRAGALRPVLLRTSGNGTQEGNEYLMVKEAERTLLQPHSSANAPVEFHESPEELRDMFSMMTLIRRFEDKTYEMDTRARMGGDRAVDS